MSCPITGGEHKYFVFKTFEHYTPVPIIDNTHGQLYKKSEIAIVNCQCGAVAKTKVKEKI
jgi:hypothetical protein